MLVRPGLLALELEHGHLGVVVEAPRKHLRVKLRRCCGSRRVKQVHAARGQRRLQLRYERVRRVRHGDVVGSRFPQQHDVV